MRQRELRDQVVVDRPQPRSPIVINDLSRDGRSRASRIGRMRARNGVCDRVNSATLPSFSWI
jgi:hypothetical protein